MLGFMELKAKDYANASFSQTNIPHTKHLYILNTQNNPKLIEYVKKCWITIKFKLNPCSIFAALFVSFNIFSLLILDFLLIFCPFSFFSFSFFVFSDKRRIMVREIVHFSTLFLTTCKIQPKITPREISH